jgi:superfamily II DNA helicase RecQ
MLWQPGDLVLARRLLSSGIAPGRWSRGMRPSDRLGFAAMRRYVHARGCRRRILLDYLGERGSVCSGCDRCSGKAATQARVRPAAPVVG